MINYEIYFKYFRDDSLRTYAKLYFLFCFIYLFLHKIDFLFPDKCTYQGIRNIHFLENFAYVVNE